MKKKIITLASLSAVFALGIGLAINTQKQPIAVEAAQIEGNFTGYTYSGSYYGSLDTTGTDGYVYFLIGKSRRLTQKQGGVGFFYACAAHAAAGLVAVAPAACVSAVMRCI